jgi:hypothetical protein
MIGFELSLSNTALTHLFLAGPAGVKMTAFLGFLKKSVRATAPAATFALRAGERQRPSMSPQS